MQAAMRVATVNDLEFVLGGRKDIYTIEEVVGEIWDVELESDLIRKAIEKNEVHVCEQNNVSQRTPFGVDYSDWANQYVFIDYVWVREDSRGKGIGKLMYEYTEQYARDHGIKEVILDVMISNPKSDFFHRAIGYKPFVQLYSKMLD